MSGRLTAKSVNRAILAKSPVHTEKTTKKKKKKTSQPGKKKRDPAKTKEKKAPSKRARKVASGPIWTVAPTLLPESLQAQLEKPFLSTIVVSGRGFCFPLENGEGAMHHAGGLHARMKTKFFRGQETHLVKPYVLGTFPRRKGSSIVEGKRADRLLATAISTLTRPSEKDGDGYATAVWDYWESKGHTPVLTQLPVYMIKANIATAGDYFTIEKSTGKLWLWELKTGWPISDKKKAHLTMGSDALAPLSIPLKPKNKWHLQALITQLAYERELGLVIDGGAHVIHTWTEREEGDVELRYRIKCKEVLRPEWVDAVDRNELYNAI